jgi:hypothetical protein
MTVLFGGSDATGGKIQLHTKLDTEVARLRLRVGGELCGTAFMNDTPFAHDKDDIGVPQFEGRPNCHS